MNNTWVYSNPWCYYTACMILGFSTVSMALPWDSSDYYDGPDTCTGGIFGEPVEHATNVNLNLFRTTAKGRMHNAKPYFVEFCVEPSNPSSFSTELAWLQTKLVEVANVSLLATKDVDDPPKPLELAYDFSTWAHESPLFIFAAGNEDQDEIVQRSYNGIIVGGDENMGDQDFSWKNPSTYYTDRELPHVVEDAYYLTSSQMVIESKEFNCCDDWQVIWKWTSVAGTSYAAPRISALAGLVIEKAKIVRNSPPTSEAIRAIIYTAGNLDCPPRWKWTGFMYIFGYWDDCQYGLGVPTDVLATDIVDQDDFDELDVTSSVYEYYGDVFTISSPDDHFRAAIAWSQPVSCNSSYGNCDNVDGYLVHDFDLYLQEATSPSGPWSTPSAFSNSDRLSIHNDTSWELIDVDGLNPLRFYRLRATMDVSGSFTSTRLGVAWRTY